jgi:glycosyltransferase involved in cell wall biosynthesis
MKNDALPIPEALRIAIVSPLIESVPPTFYGGTERVVSYLTEELVRQGHHVTLFASGDSVTSAQLHAPVPQSLRLAPDCRDPMAAHILMLDQVYERAPEFDVIHFNLDHFHLPVCRHLRLPAVTTLHGRLDNPELGPLFRHFRDAPLISISDAQREPLPFANWVATIHHGLPRNLLPFNERPGDYLAFLGRISPEKRPDRAIRIARRAGIPLRIAAKVDRADQEYFEQQIRPLLKEPGVEYIGEIGEREKGTFLGNARAMLFPIDWPEPFGIVLIEAMACGTPVIAYGCGSVPEVVEDGRTGYIVDNEDAAVAAVQKVLELDRVACRKAFERRFTVERMARDYAQVFHLVRQGQGPRPATAKNVKEVAGARPVHATQLSPTAGSSLATPLAKPSN